MKKMKKKNQTRNKTSVTIKLATACLLFTIINFSLSAASEAAEKPDLQITIATNKKIYHRKDEVAFTETIKNISRSTVQIVDDKCGYGSDLKVMRLSDHSECTILPSSAGHTLKPGLRPGVRQFLKPNQSFTRKFSAYISDDLQLAFQNHGAASFTGFSAGATNEIKLPEKFFGCGQVFDLHKPGQYKITATYSNNGDWSTGEIHPSMPLWQGTAQSNPIEIEVRSAP